MIRRPPRIRLTRVSLGASLLLIFTFYYLFLQESTELPEELLSSPIFHRATEAGSQIGGRWSKTFSKGTEESIGLEYSDDGLVRGWDSAHDLIKTASLPKREKKKVKEVRDRHPIETLMEVGKTRWEALLAK